MHEGEANLTEVVCFDVFKGTVQQDFLPPVLSPFEPVWATDQWVNIFSILVQISRSYSKFRFITTEDSPRYDTPASQKKFHPRTMVQT